MSDEWDSKVSYGTYEMAMQNLVFMGNRTGNIREYKLIEEFDDLDDVIPF